MDGRQVLSEIYETGSVVAADGSVESIHSAISRKQASALMDLVHQVKPSEVIEIGMAFGLSSVAILTALEDNDHGRLTSIDPLQADAWNGAGVTAAKRAGLDHRHLLIEDYDFAALPRLLDDRGRSVQLAFIDGWHTFDHVLLDAFYLDKMLEPGGVMVFDDAPMAAVSKAIAYLLAHRHYQEIDVGLAELHRKGRGRFVHRPRRFVRGRYFRKLDTYEPSWDFFARF